MNWSKLLFLNFWSFCADSENMPDVANGPILAKKSKNSFIRKIPKKWKNPIPKFYLFLLNQVGFSRI
jgi:hypothetical protein